MEDVAVNDRLPPRLFATDRYPSNRNNCYSSLEFLLLVRDVLEGSAEMERLLCSCAFSAKLVHGMLSRQLVTKKRFEMWHVFGGGPTRFSLAEFGHVTGLPCGEFEQGYEVDEKTKPKKTNYVFWDKLFGGRRNLNLEDLAAMVVGEITLSPGKKLRICLIIIVDGVLMPKMQKPKPTLKYVKLVEKLDKFFSFPWGRESFWWTISTMIPPKKVLGKRDDPEGIFCAQLRQETKFLLGFPLALQLWVFEAIPVLLDRLGGDDSVTLLSYVGDKLPTHTGLVLTDVLYVEHSPKLTVLPMMEVDEDRDDEWGVFDCEIFVRKVAYMVDLLISGHKFQKGEWGGSDVAEPLYVHDPTVTEVKKKIRKLTQKEEAGAVMKQRRLSRPQAVAEHALKEGDGVPLLYTKKEDVTEQAHVVIFGSGSNTFYITEEEGSQGSQLLAALKWLTSVSQDFGDLNRLVGVITRGVTGTVAEKEVGKATEGGAATKDTDGQSMEADGNAMERGNLMEGPNEKSGEALKVDESVAALDVKEAKGGGKKGPTVDSLVAEKTVENCPNAEHNVALAKQAVVDEEIVGEEATSEGEGCNSDGNGDK
ncbi:PREDICTED: uncharacterized protein LOC106344442 [Brassica oleracea var. oleracea]|uniref:uncharacterized protein LOC106344442 n=1 Tax=Brassica oleracea var. oleracea TaxID=109376 RepID=UPI0006A6D33D|nr:PREDICTED: uncharacterized protein LOC106344442 [Brassica oleracea var. oleracea]